MSERDDFGPGLRRERERRNITLRQIADKTKISASFFAAMERNDFSRWPSGIFRRSFLRAYAETVGLDGERLVQDFVRLFPADGDQADPESPAPAPSAHDASRSTAREVREHRPAARAADGRTREQRAASNEARPALTLALPAAPKTEPARARVRVAALVIDVGVTAFVAFACGLAFGWSAAWPAAALTATALFVLGSVLRQSTVGVWLVGGAEPPAREQAPEPPVPESRPVAKRRAIAEPHTTSRRHQVRRVERPRLM